MMTLKRFKWLVLGLIVLLVLFLIGPPAALASDDNRGPSVDVVTDVTTDVNTTTNVTGGDMVNQIAGDSYSSRAYGFSHSLGDVDINQCIVSKQTGTFIVSWQGYDYNLWCMGEVFDAKGLFKMGAEMRCDIEPIASKFEFREDCLAANTVDQEITESPQLADLYNKYAQFEEYQVIEDEHDEELERLQQEQVILMDRVDHYEQQLEQRPAPVIVQQEPVLSEHDKQRVWDIIQSAKGEPEK